MGNTNTTQQFLIEDGAMHHFLTDPKKMFENYRDNQHLYEKMMPSYELDIHLTGCYKFHKLGDPPTETTLARYEKLKSALLNSELDGKMTGKDLDTLWNMYYVSGDPVFANRVLQLSQSEQAMMVIRKAAAWSYDSNVNSGHVIDQTPLDVLLRQRPFPINRIYNAVQQACASTEFEPVDHIVCVETDSIRMHPTYVNELGEKVSGTRIRMWNTPYTKGTLDVRIMLEPYRVKLFGRASDEKETLGHEFVQLAKSQCPIHVVTDCPNETSIYQLAQTIQIKLFPHLRDQ